ncbi:MAG: hypothetical protein VB118_08905 [Oscillospiraceae bacterium]|nr:hypothetical protein [Oscillospiraceae bacterium]
MKKLMVDGKEISIDDKMICQLSDDELESACGGTNNNGKLYFRLVCDQCRLVSWWNPKKAEQIYLTDFHKSLGCIGTLKDELEYFDSDPDLTT